ncbi:hypothetical protein [Luteibacter sp. ME-Dv--P-043b]|uniref:hypothetical protein n=1 Tax=Luteibacter sp. ME-Dv--P-043b TaxID=3040291 RepID=UPI002556B38F|nr:hypothetical protein [Luteibacter sp. ME-Dv--P-043b]
MARDFARQNGWIGIAAILLATACFVLIFIPFSPSMPRLDQDASWPLALNAAVERGLVFGRDVVFTGGPLAAVYTQQFSPGTGGEMWAVAFFFATISALALIAIVPRRSRAWLLFVPFLAPLPGMRDAFFLGIPWLLVLTARHVRTHGTRGIKFLTYALVAACALLPLIKGSASPPAFFCVIIAARILIDKQRIHIWLVPTVFLTTLGLGWISSGQPLTALGSYLCSQMEIIEGYGDAMSVSGSVVEVMLLAFAGILLSLCVHWPVRSRRWSVSFATVVTLFVAFKAGAIRHDGHIALAADMIILVSIYVVAGTGPRPLKWLATASLCMAMIVLSHYTDISPRGLFVKVANAIDKSLSGLSRVWDESDHLNKDFKRAGDFVRNELPLVDAGKSVDLYNSEIAAVILGQGVWKPRPVFQSYSAYSPALIERNVNHLRKTPPDRIYWRIQTIDDRYPSLDDGASWPWLFGTYRPIAHIGDYLQLDRIGEPTRLSNGAAILERVVALGKPVALPRGDPLWARIVIRPTLVGKLWGALYKLPPLMLSFRYADGHMQSFRVVAGMMETGFLLSPTVGSTRELEVLWTKGAENMPSSRLPIEMQLSVSDWTGSLFPIHYSLFLARLPIPKAAIPRRSLDPVEPDPGSVASGGQCAFESEPEAGIRIIGGSLVLPSEMAFVSLKGWAAADVSAGALGDATFLLLRGAGGMNKLVRARATSRMDVAKVFGRPSLINAGFDATFSLDEMARPIRVTVVKSVAGVLRECSGQVVTVY